MRAGRLPQNSFDRLMKAAGQSDGRAVRTVGGVCHTARETIASASMLLTSEEAAKACILRAYTMLKSYGVRPEDSIIEMNLRRRDSESRVKGYLKAVKIFCEEHGMNMHLSLLQTPGDLSLINITCMGEKKEERKRNYQGMHIIAAGNMGAYGVVRLIDARKEELLEYFPSEWLDNARRYSVTDCDEIFDALKDYDLLMQPAAEGGIMAALWDMKERCRCGFNIDLFGILFRQEAIEICERLGLNPYNLSSDGGMLIVTEDKEKVMSALSERMIPCGYLGVLTEEKACIISKKDEITCLDRPDADPIWQFV